MIQNVHFNDTYLKLFHYLSYQCSFEWRVPFNWIGIAKTSRHHYGIVPIRWSGLAWKILKVVFLPPWCGKNIILVRTVLEIRNQNSTSSKIRIINTAAITFYTCVIIFLVTPHWSACKYLLVVVTPTVFRICWVPGWHRYTPTLWVHGTAQSLPQSALQLTRMAPIFTGQLVSTYKLWSHPQSSRSARDVGSLVSTGTHLPCGYMEQLRVCLKVLCNSQEWDLHW